MGRSTMLAVLTATMVGLAGSLKALPSPSSTMVATTVQDVLAETYVWLPCTWNVPLASWTIVPALTGVPSPQFTVAMKSDALPNESRSLNVATSTFVSGDPSTPLIAAPKGLNGASAMVTFWEAWKNANPGASSLTLTFRSTVPGLVYV